MHIAVVAGNSNLDRSGISEHSRFVRVFLRCNQKIRRIVAKKKNNGKSNLDHLPVIQVFHWKSRSKPALKKGDRVYYGPFPATYGIGVVQNVSKGLVAVDFRGLGKAGVHEDVIHERYLVPYKETASQ